MPEKRWEQGSTIGRGGFSVNLQRGPHIINIYVLSAQISALTLSFLSIVLSCFKNRPFAASWPSWRGRLGRTRKDKHNHFKWSDLFICLILERPLRFSIAVFPDSKTNCKGPITLQPVYTGHVVSFFFSKIDEHASEENVWEQGGYILPVWERGRSTRARALDDL